MRLVSDFWSDLSQDFSQTLGGLGTEGPGDFSQTFLGFQGPEGLRDSWSSSGGSRFVSQCPERKRCVKIYPLRLRETLCESGSWIDALKKRGRALKKRGRFLKKRGRVLKKRRLVRGTGGGPLLQKGGGWLLKKRGFLRSRGGP